jgi:hypothetical protein
MARRKDGIENSPRQYISIEPPHSVCMRFITHWTATFCMHEVYYSLNRYILYTWGLLLTEPPYSVYMRFITHWTATFCMHEVYYSHVYVMSIYNLENIEIVQWSVIDLVLILFLVLIYCFNMSKSYQYYKVMDFFFLKFVPDLTFKMYFPIMWCIDQNKVM